MNRKISKAIVSQEAAGAFLFQDLEADIGG